jgi:uncharacterized SAM-binding protein YcdF (DUF218 family)
MTTPPISGASIKAAMAILRNRKWPRLFLALLALFCIWNLVLGISIVNAGNYTNQTKADAAIVLGAATKGDRPSPVFEERIKHGIILFKSGRVRSIIFTGGAGTDQDVPESIVAKNYALARGIPEQAILIETTSRTTMQNLTEAKRVITGSGLRTAIIVTDPLHIKRALKMADGLGMVAAGSPTPTTRYKSWRSKLPFLLREIYFYNVHLILGV